MLLHLSEPPPWTRQKYDIVELFAGKGRIARLGQSRGYNILCHDMLYDKVFTADSSSETETKQRKRSCMDMNGSAGFLPFVHEHSMCMVRYFHTASMPYYKRMPYVV